MSAPLARIRIDNTLFALGWRLNSSDTFAANVCVCGDCKSLSDAKLLKGNRPDYILYDDNDNIIALIEAKQDAARSFADGLKQCMRYADMLARKNIVCFCSDGNITVAQHGNGQSLTINGEMVDELLSPYRVEKLAMAAAINVEEELDGIRELINIFNGSADILREDGVELGLDSLREFCLLLFIKVISEKRQHLPGCDWEEFKQKSGAELKAAYIKIVNAYRKKYRDIFHEGNIRKAGTLKQLIERIDGIKLTRSSLDIKGGAYEHFLSKFHAGQKSVLGQYFTPRHITRMMGKLMDFRIGETIYDPFCGTGGMLITCYSLLQNQIKNDERAKNRRLHDNVLYGSDIAPTAAQLTKMNMVLLGEDRANIRREDSLNNLLKGKYDAVITNIPFGLSPVDRRTAKLYQSESNNAHDICLRHCMFALKKGGRAAIIVPETVAYLPLHQKLRNFIKANAAIKAVIRLPRETFKPHTAARTCILLLEKVWAANTATFIFADIKHDGFSGGAWREPIAQNDIPQLLSTADNWAAHYPKIAAGDNYRWFPDHVKWSPAIDKSWALSELVEVISDKTALNPDALYMQPLINSKNNTVTCRGEPRLGRNIKGAGKVIALPGHLIISTLHTQNGNGMFAVSNGNYICTSQIVARIKKDMVEREYLCFMLRKILPTLESRDLVGRETYKPSEILSLRIPKPESISDKTGDKINRLNILNKQRAAIEQEIAEIERNILF